MHHVQVGCIMLREACIVNIRIVKSGTWSDADKQYLHSSWHARQWLMWTSLIFWVVYKNVKKNEEGLGAFITWPAWSGISYGQPFVQWLVLKNIQIVPGSSHSTGLFFLQSGLWSILPASLPIPDSQQFFCLEKFDRQVHINRFCFLFVCSVWVVLGGSSAFGQKWTH